MFQIPDAVQQQDGISNTERLWDLLGAWQIVKQSIADLHNFSKPHIVLRLCNNPVFTIS